MKINCSGEQYVCERVFCVGNNYSEHVAEIFGNKPEPAVFMKPATSIVLAGGVMPSVVAEQIVHYETELTVLIGKNGVPKNEADTVSFIAGLGVGLDLTLRDLQINHLRPERLPWEIAKSFEASAPLSDFTAFDPAVDQLDNLTFYGAIDQQIRQQGNSKDMIIGIPGLIYLLAKYWKFRPGDVIFTGTPKGVGALPTQAEIVLTDHKSVKHFWTCQPLV